MKSNRKSWVCPLCGTKTTDYPAISRRDNKTEICSDCGTREALEDFYGKKLPVGSVKFIEKGGDSDETSDQRSTR